MRTFFPAGALPKLTIAQRVIDKIVQNALIYQTETGESLIGFRIPTADRPEPDLYVLETIPPDESAIRGAVVFEQGDDEQGDKFVWYSDNWRLLLRPKLAGTSWDAPLVHLGDWHKHPGDLTTPSGGDAETAREYISDEHAGAPQLLVILATVWDQWMLEEVGGVRALLPHEITELFGPLETITKTRKVDQNSDYTLRIPIENNLIVRIDFWYMSQQVRRFTRLKPNVVPNSAMPELVPMNWHLADADRLTRESLALDKANYAVEVKQFDTDHQAPLKICFALAKRGSSHILIFIAPPDYPNSKPLVRLTPMSAAKDMPEGADVFTRLWEASQPLSDAVYRTLTWTPTSTLVDLAHEVEAHLTEGKN